MLLPLVRQSAAAREVHAWGLRERDCPHWRENLKPTIAPVVVPARRIESLSSLAFRGGPSLVTMAGVGDARRLQGMHVAPTTALCRGPPRGVSRSAVDRH
jgi:hypothetical protein